MSPYAGVDHEDWSRTGTGTIASVKSDKLYVHVVGQAMESSETPRSTHSGHLSPALSSEEILRGRWYRNEIGTQVASPNIFIGNCRGFFIPLLKTSSSASLQLTIHHIHRLIEIKRLKAIEPASRPVQNIFLALNSLHLLLGQSELFSRRHPQRSRVIRRSLRCVGRKRAGE